MKGPAYFVLAAALASSAGLAQSVWSQIQTPNSPPHLSGAAMVYDGANGVIVLFGGRTSGGQPWDRTYTFDGTTWSQVSPPVKPPGRAEAGICYDSARQRVVLVGGDGESDCWTWDGVTWTLQGNGLFGQGYRTAAFDAVRNVVVTVRNGRVAEWDGTPGPGQWVVTQPPVAPPNYASDMVFDAAAGRCLLFVNGETWHWDGAAFTQLNPTASPSPRIWHRMAYEAHTGRTILFGGNASGYQNDTWAWDGANWAQQIAAGPPPARDLHNLAYDPVNQRVVLHGGRPVLSDTWFKNQSHSAPATVTPFGSACPGSVTTPQLSATSGSLPWIGTTQQLDLTNLPFLVFYAPFGVLGLSDTNWGGVPLPADLSRLGMTGCQAFVSVEQITPLVNTFGTARWQIPIPNVANLVGAHLFAQGLLVDPQANAFGLIVTNALDLEIGAI